MVATGTDVSVGSLTQRMSDVDTEGVSKDSESVSGDFSSWICRLDHGVDTGAVSAGRTHEVLCSVEKWPRMESLSDRLRLEG